MFFTWPYLSTQPTHDYILDHLLHIFVSHISSHHFLCDTMVPSRDVSRILSTPSPTFLPYNNVYITFVARTSHHQPLCYCTLSTSTSSPRCSTLVVYMHSVHSPVFCASSRSFPDNFPPKISAIRACSFPTSMLLSFQIDRNSSLSLQFHMCGLLWLLVRNISHVVLVLLQFHHAFLHIVALTLRHRSSLLWTHIRHGCRFPLRTVFTLCQFPSQYLLNYSIVPQLLLP